MSIPLAVQHDQHICICMSHFHEHWSWTWNTCRQRAQPGQFWGARTWTQDEIQNIHLKAEKPWIKNNENSAAEWSEPTPLCCLVFDDVFVTYLQWFQVAPDAKFGDSQRVTTPRPKIAVKLGAGEGTATSAPGLCPSTCSFRLFTFEDTTSKYIRSFRRFRLGSIVLCCCVPMWFFGVLQATAWQCVPWTSWGSSFAQRQRNVRNRDNLSSFFGSWDRGFS